MPRLLQGEQKIGITEVAGFRPLGLQPAPERRDAVVEEVVLGGQHPKFEELQQLMAQSCRSCSF